MPQPQKGDIFISIKDWDETAGCIIVIQMAEGFDVMCTCFILLTCKLISPKIMCDGELNILQTDCGSVHNVFIGS